MKLFAIEGNPVKLDGGAMFGNAPKELWKKWAVPDDQNRISLATRCLLVQTDAGKNILFEAGCGACYDQKFRERFGIDATHFLVNNLAAIGVNPCDIDAVVLSHLHFDHAGGLLSAFDEGPLRLVFTKAQYYLGKEHWGRAKAPHVRDQASFIPLLHALLEQSGRLILLDSQQKNLSGLGMEISLRYSNGHTPGLMLSQIELDSGPLFYVADLVPGMPWMHVPITMGYDRYPEKLIDEKRALFGDFESVGGKIFFTHDPQVSCVKVAKDINGKYFGEIATVG